MTAPGEDRTPEVVIIGGGISGLAAAWAMAHPGRARERSARSVAPTITVLEAGAVFGGKIRTTRFADVDVDTGPDAFLARAPWATRLCVDLGIGDRLVAPSEQKAYLWSRGHLHHFPNQTVLGVPSSLRSLVRSGAVHPAGVAFAAADLVLPRFVGRRRSDPTIGGLVRRRLGREVAERLVDPLVGGINAGSVDELSLSATSPQIADLAERHRSLMRGARDAIRRRDLEQPDAPVFLTPLGGMSELVTALEQKLTAAGVALRAKADVTAIRRESDDRWRIEIEGEAPISADAVLITAPAPAAAGLLAGISPEASRLLSAIEYASVAIVRLAYTTASIPHDLEGSGYVVPAVDGRLVTACSWASSKWGHLSRPGQVVLRASVGRHHDDRFAVMSDDELVTAVHDELAQSLGVVRRPFAADVTRWNTSFPQYAPGHENRVIGIEQALAGAPGLAVAGAAYRGLGIPSCVRNAGEAAELMLTRLASTVRRS